MSEHTLAPASEIDNRSSRMLSKSDFKLARTCDAKLFFRENRFTDNRAGNPYLTLLAEGGYMVEALAKAKYPNGVRPEYDPDPRAACARTIAYLQRDDVVLFEATLVVGRQQARADILEKRGNVIRLLPPLVIGEELLREGLDVLSEATTSILGAR